MIKGLFSFLIYKGVLLYLESRGSYQKIKHYKLIDVDNQ